MGWQGEILPPPIGRNVKLQNGGCSTVTHDQYGKNVLKLATGGQFQHWFVEEERAFEYPSGGIIAKLDGVIGEDCVVEVEGLNEKQIRAGILDLVFHPRPKKLLVIIPANLSKTRREDIQQAYQRLLDDLVHATHSSAIGRVLVLKGTGHDPEEYLDEDRSMLRQALQFLNPRISPVKE